MSVQYAKPKGSIGLPSVEQIHILRDPPKSLWTKKKERVDMSDVTYMVREQDDRINENISYFGKGYNPMVEVQYSNQGSTSRGPGAGTLATNEVKNPFKVMKDGAFRPPLFTQAQLLPLSRQKWVDHAVITNPGLPDYSFSPDLFEKVDKAEIKKSYQMNSTRGDIRPTVFRKISYPKEIYTRNNISQLKAELYDKNITSTASWNITTSKQVPVEKKYIKETLLKLLPPNFSIIVYDSGNRSHSTVQASIKEKENIAVNSTLNLPIHLQTENGQYIKLKDYKYSIVESTPGLPSLMLTIQHQPDLQLQNNIPLYTVTSNVSAKSDKPMENFQFDLTTKQQTGPIGTNKSDYSTGTPIQEMNTSQYTKPSLIEEYRNAGFNNAGTIPIYSDHNIPVSKKKKLEIEDYNSRF